MADPFEVRVRFTHQLQRLDASAVSAQKAAAYALKYRDMDEDLHSCILEQLEKNNMNIRANILYFIVHLCDSADRSGHREFISMVQRDIGRIIDAVAPNDGSGAANVKVARQVLQNLFQKGYLSESLQTELPIRLDEPSRQGLSISASALPQSDTTLVESNGDDGSAVADVVMADAADMTEDGSRNPAGHSKPSPLAAARPNGARRNSISAKAGTAGGSNPPSATTNSQSRHAPTTRIRLDRKQIEQRIEEDRERHKRLREKMWAVNPETEYSRMWEETSDIGSDDYRDAATEADLRERMIQFE